MNKMTKNILIGVVVLIVCLIVRKLWLPDGIWGLIK
jgi:hypothetical protein